LPYLACISADYAFLFKMNVIALSEYFAEIIQVKNRCFKTNFLLQLYNLS